MTENQIENPGKLHQRNIPKNSYMKFYPILSRGRGEMASDGQTDGRTDEAATICSPFGEHNYADIPLKKLSGMKHRSRQKM